jgi:outer membrane protein assembly factor BamE (lipoprotein component of BamABCDE complex)
MNKKILKLTSEFEALKIKDILDSEGIPHMIRSFHDSAYDGMFQTQYGWGVLLADEKDEETILKLIKE